MDRRGTWGGRLTAAMAASLLATPVLAEDVRPMDEVPDACMQCHSAGEAFMGAPTVGDPDAWEFRIDARGMDGLVRNTERGIGAMPPNGGTDLTSEEIRGAILAMLRESDVDIDDLPE